jgi:large subunit ribosomal protein L24
MKQSWSSSWKASTQRRKQRKYRYNAPIHVLGNFMNAHLVKNLREKYQTRSIRIRVGDKVKILRGQNKKKEGKISRVDVKNSKVFVEGIERGKGDGSKSFYPINPSNVMILELIDDKKRMRRFQSEKSAKQTETKQPKETKLSEGKQELPDKEVRSTKTSEAKASVPEQSQSKPVTLSQPEQKKVENKEGEKQ